MHDRAGAEIAAPVVEDRLARLAVARNPRLTFAGLFPIRAVAPAAEGPLLLIDLTLQDGRPAATWRQLLFNRDLGFVAW